MRVSIKQLKNLLSEKSIGNKENQPDFFYYYESKNSKLDFDNLVLRHKKNIFFFLFFFKRKLKDICVCTDEIIEKY